MNLLGSFSVRAKMLLATSVPLVLMLVTILLTIRQISAIGTELESITKLDVPLTHSFTVVTEQQLEQIIEFERVLGLTLNAADKGDTAYTIAQFTKNFEQLNRSIDEELDESRKIIDHSLLNGIEENQKQRVSDFRKEIDSLDQQHSAFSALVFRIVQLVKNGDFQQAEVNKLKADDQRRTLNEHSKTILAEIEEMTADGAIHAEQLEKSAINMLTVLLIVALIIGVFSSWSISSALINRLQAVSAAVGYVAEGDLTQTIVAEGSDEIATLQLTTIKMRDQLTDMLTKIKSSTEHLSTAAVQLSGNTLTSSDNLQRQQQEIEQLASAMHEMTATALDMASNISIAATAAHEANEETVTGRRVVSNLVEAVKELSLQINSAADAINTVQQDSENINSVLAVIKGVAEQTNLLALNAAIEAARAGEQGRGFAVVADEVRTLASRTQSSTEEINQTIEKLQSGSAKAVQVMQQSSEKVNTMVAEAQSADQSLVSISEAITGISNMSIQIATATEEQSSVAEEINRNVVGISDMSRSTNETARESATAAEGLNDLASELIQLVTKFKT